MGDRLPKADALGPDTQLIEVYVAELKQLFNAIDPSPFGEKDLDPGVEEFIVSWSREMPRGAPLALLVHVDRPAGPLGEPSALREAVGRFFRHRSGDSRRRLQHLFRRGRTSLAIGLLFLTMSIGLGDIIATAIGRWRFGELLSESLLIGGWVAMWRPLEIFLYDWWPIRAESRLYDRLSEMPVRIAYSSEVSSHNWQEGRPAIAVRAAVALASGAGAPKS